MYAENSGLSRHQIPDRLLLIIKRFDGNYANFTTPFRSVLSVRGIFALLEIQPHKRRMTSGAGPVSMTRPFLEQGDAMAQVLDGRHVVADEQNRPATLGHLSILPMHLV